MSYCRFSSDDYKSDIYAYEANEGFFVHVANRRYDGDIPKLPVWDEVTPEEYFSAMAAQTETIKNLPMVDIGGPYDGQCFIYESLHDLRDGLKSISEVGYNVPQFVFDAIEEEIKGAL